MVIELMGSMIYLAVQKHQSPSGFALSQKNISALTNSPRGHNLQEAKQNKQRVRGLEELSWHSHLGGRKVCRYIRAGKPFLTRDRLPTLLSSTSFKVSLPSTSYLSAPAQLCSTAPSVFVCARGRCQSLESPGSHPCHSLAGPCELGTRGSSAVSMRACCSSGSGHDLQLAC